MPNERPIKIKKNLLGQDAEWVLSDWFCASCGKRDMWQEFGAGSDYYHDCDARCGSCDFVMCCVGEVERVTDTEPWWIAAALPRQPEDPTP